MLRNRTTAVLALATTIGCRSPTEMSVELETDEPCAMLQGTTISAGPPGDGASTPKARAVTCTEGTPLRSLGSIEVVPTGAKNDAVSLRVITGVMKPPESCGPTLGYDGCIVARRALRFVPHTPLRLPIALRAVCLGVACDEESTCVKGVCEKAEITDTAPCATAAGCDEKTLFPGNDVEDAGVDATLLADSAVDANRDADHDADHDADAGPVIDAGGDARTGPCGSVASVVASGQASPFMLVNDGTRVYWTNSGSDGGVYALEADGGISALAANTTNATYLATNRGSVFWADNVGATAHVTQVVFGGSPLGYFPGPSVAAPITSLTASRTDVAWTTGTTLYLASTQAFADASADNFAPYAQPLAYANDDDGGILALKPIDGGTQIQLLPGFTSLPTEEPVFAVGLNAERYYWTIDSPSGGVTSVARNAPNGTTTTLVYPGGARFVAVQGPRFFFAPAGNKVVQMRTDVSGGGAIVLASGMSAVTGLTVMGSCVYFAVSPDPTLSSGTIQTVAIR